MEILRDFIKKHFLQIITAIFWALIIFSYFYYRNAYHYSDSELMKKVYFLLKREWMYGWVIYVSLYILRTFIFFPSSILIILSPSLFGLPMALFYTMLWENLSSAFGYYLWKFFWKNIISETYLDKFSFLKKSFREDSFVTILTARLLFIPFDPLSYVSWFFKAKFAGYIWWTLIWTLPSILIFLFVWAWIKNIETFSLSNIDIDQNFLLLSVLLILLSLILVFFIKYLQKKHKKTL
ncbi:MAG: hypothetical protein ACD_2C00073G0024 [uncultured bacterium (gcode 4)]|uniref:TVP38/TMEM64 family membrane protein n=1 Tax=uncultured bacterium (gcode 4) TaxID=1234023 RepID=K2FFF9_9BACT|nr:MAG: hypothetical protein ACD_2C00073G0024 [uncultured bacterium (gcode 4)]